MLKFINEFGATVEKSITLPEGNYAGLLLVNDGDVGSSAETDFADVYILKGGEPIAFLKLDELKELDNILYGMPVLTYDSTNLLFSALQLFIPFSLLPPKNTILNVEKEDHFSLQFIPKTITSGNLLLYGVIAEAGAENYMLNINRQVIQGSGRLATNLSGENFLALYVIPDANATRLNVEKDGDNVVNAETSVLIASTEMFSKIESGTLSSCLIDLAPTGSISEALNDNIRVIADHSADGTTIVYSLYATFDTARIEKSAVKTQVIEQNKIEKKFNRTVSPAKKEIIKRISPIPFTRGGRIIAGRRLGGGG